MILEIEIHKINMLHNLLLVFFCNASLQTTISNLMKMAESSLKLVENTVGKGKVACYEQFLLFPQSFRKICTANTKKPGFVQERVEAKFAFNNLLSFIHLWMNYL